jgi:uncharacterized protein
MTKNRAEQMVERLRNMQAAAPDIEASAVVSVDGLIMASALQQGVEEDRVSAMSAAMLSLGERISNELGRKGLEQVYIKGDKGSIVLTSIGEEAVLTALARQDAKLGMIFLEMRRAAEDIFQAGWMIHNEPATTQKVRNPRWGGLHRPPHLLFLISRREI